MRIPIISKRTRKQWFNVNAFHDKESEGGKSGINPPDLHTYIHTEEKQIFTRKQVLDGKRMKSVEFFFFVVPVSSLSICVCVCVAEG